MPIRTHQVRVHSTNDIGSVQDTSDGHIVLDDGPSVPSLVGLIPLGAMKWESR
jgi:hypothetical protein